MAWSLLQEDTLTPWFQFHFPSQIPLTWPKEYKKTWKHLMRCKTRKCPPYARDSRWDTLQMTTVGSDQTVKHYVGGEAGLRRVRMQSGVEYCAESCVGCSQEPALEKWQWRAHLSSCRSCEDVQVATKRKMCLRELPALGIFPSWG